MRARLEGRQQQLAQPRKRSMDILVGTGNPVYRDQQALVVGTSQIANDVCSSSNVQVSKQVGGRLLVTGAC